MKKELNFTNVVYQYVLNDEGVYYQKEIHTRTKTIQPHTFPELDIDLNIVFM